MNWRSRGKHLDFVDHKYLKQIYTDYKGKGNGVIVYQKSAQIGITERMLTEALWLPDQYNYNSIYFFPTTGTLGDLVSERIDRPINESKHLMEVSGRAKIIMGKHADKLGLKRMTNGFVYFRGSNALPAITSVAGDAIFVDEVDRMAVDNIPYFEKRLEHSDLRWQRWASTPTIPNFGINKMFRKTDQCVWMVKCNHCGKYQELNFYKNIDIDNKHIFCVKCKKIIVPWQLDGEWIAKYPDKDTRGYHICQLYSPKLNIKKFIEDSQRSSEAEIQQFYNQNLGLPYESSGSRISEQDLHNCKGGYKMGDIPENERLFMGVDVGKYLHYIVRSKDKIIMMGSVTDFFGVNSIEEIMKTYRVYGIVFDALPETRKVQEFIKKYPKKAKMCYYTGLAEMKEARKYWNVSDDKVNTDRTVSLDMVFAEFKQREVKIPDNYDVCIDFSSHLKSTSRIIQENASGIAKAVYIETGDDHLLHACQYAKLAVNIYNVASPEIFII